MTAVRAAETKPMEQEGPQTPVMNAVQGSANASSYDKLIERMVEFEKKEDNLRQDMNKMSDKLVIDEQFRKAKAIVPPKDSEPAPQQMEENPAMTEQQIIKGLIKPELKDTKTDLDFDEVKLSDIFRTLGSAGNINIFLDPNIKGLQTEIHLQKVSIDEALLLMANAYDLGYSRVENSLFVAPKEKLKSQSITSKVFKLQNIKAQDAKTLVDDIVQTVNVSDEINSIIVIGQPKEIEKVEQVLKTIDVPQPQVILEAKIIEVNKDALKDLGVDWSDQINLQYQEGGRPVDMANVEDPSSKVFSVEAFQRNPIQFSAVIKMLENQNKAKVLSNPKITTLNDKEAEIFVGDRIPYTVTTISGGVATTDVRFEEPGIRLKITPSIIGDDFVVIKVEPEVSFIFAFRGPNDEFPQTKKRQATAYVRVKNNQPFILGGLLNQEDKKNLYKVPMLGDVPLLGNLFSYEKHTLLDTELIITVTPTIVHGQF